LAGAPVGCASTEPAVRTEVSINAMAVCVLFMIV
jgi:hypothetical protein